MTQFVATRKFEKCIPAWVPEAARHYLLHVGAGLPIRELARMQDCHASTILRQVRRYENRRDDPLIDRGLERLGAAQLDAAEAACLPSQRDLDSEALRVLRRMCESGAVLAVGEGMDKAVVVRDGESGGTARLAVLEVPVAEALALCGWIDCETAGRIARYRVTQTGRQALTRLMSQAEQRGMAEAQTPFEGAGDDASGGRRARYNLAESPLLGLARRRDRDGTPFLTPELVAAGERLREDFELAQMDPRVTQSWDAFLTAGSSTGRGASDPLSGPAAARARVALALRDLGPGLGDMALRCCCHLEGLEVAEKRMGWSARSGKIVLRIALQRLRLHYEESRDTPAPLIG